jgi:hypothetical protein
MFENVQNYYATATEWLNDNQGLVAVGIFLITLFFGWFSGIFSALRRRPKFKLSFIDGPTFCCTFPTGKMKDEQPIHRTGIALYLAVANTGYAASSIENISVGYHWHVRPFTRTGFRYRVGWFWLHHQTPVIHDFQAKIGENIKIFPFLTQRSFLGSDRASTFLEPGRSVNGVVYFEQPDSWGGCFPSPTRRGVRVKLAVRDVFGKAHIRKFWIKLVTLDAAREYNPSFGKTYAEMKNETLPYDANISRIEGARLE